MNSSTQPATPLVTVNDVVRAEHCLGAVSVSSQLRFIYRMFRSAIFRTVLGQQWGVSCESAVSQPVLQVLLRVGCLWPGFGGGFGAEPEVQLRWDFTRGATCSSVLSGVFASVRLLACVCLRCIVLCLGLEVVVCCGCGGMLRSLVARCSMKNGAVKTECGSSVQVLID